MMNIHINKEDNHISTTQICKYLNKLSMKGYLHDFNKLGSKEITVHLASNERKFLFSIIFTSLDNLPVLVSLSLLVVTVKTHIRTISTSVLI